MSCVDFKVALLVDTKSDRATHDNAKIRWRPIYKARTMPPMGETQCTARRCCRWGTVPAAVQRGVNVEERIEAKTWWPALWIG
eukprot:495421-Amphidinium_carterae.1